MKKITMLFVALCVTVVGYAQFEKGTFLVGGSLGAKFTTNKTKFDGNSRTNSKYSEFSFDPQFGIFVIDHLAVGAAIGFRASTYKEDDSDYKEVSTEITIEPMVRYYLPPGVFFQGRFLIGPNTDKYVDNGTTEKYKYTVSGFSLGVGYAYFLADGIAIEPMIGYGSKGYKNKDTDRKFVDAGLYLRVGFQIYLKKLSFKK